MTASDGGHHLNLRAPDDLAIELFVISQADGALISGGPPAVTSIHFAAMPAVNLTRDRRRP